MLMIRQQDITEESDNVDRLHYVDITSLLIQWPGEEVITMGESSWCLSVHGRQIGWITIKK